MYKYCILEILQMASNRLSFSTLVSRLWSLLFLHFYLKHNIYISFSSLSLHLSLLFGLLFFFSHGPFCFHLFIPVVPSFSFCEVFQAFCLSLSQLISLSLPLLSLISLFPSLCRLSRCLFFKAVTSLREYSMTDWHLP